VPPPFGEQVTVREPGSEQEILLVLLLFAFSKLHDDAFAAG
jgi:hypothetical protein